MANKVYNEVEITLQDGTDVILEPLPIGQLRRFMAAWEGMKDITAETESFDIFIVCSGISLENHFRKANKFNATRGPEGEPLSNEYREYLESTLDMETIFKIMEVCGDLKLNDPKLLAAMETAPVAPAVEDGTS